MIDNFTPSDWAAWYAAFVATGAALWPVYVHFHSGPRLKGRALPSRAFFGEGANPYDGVNFTALDVCNVGNHPLTIKNVVGYYYSNRFRLILGLQSMGLVNLNPNNLAGKPLPARLEPGESWMFTWKEDAHFLDMVEEGFLVFGITYNHDKELRIRALKPKQAQVNLKSPSMLKT